MVEKNSDIKIYPETERVKVSQFKTLSSPDNVRDGLLHAMMQEIYDKDDPFENPLYQVRFLMDPANEILLAERLATAFDPLDYKQIGINGKIPFQIDGSEVALYYAHIESNGRKGFQSNPEQPLSHTEAVKRGLNKRMKLRNDPLDSNFRIEAINYQTGQYWKRTEDTLTEIEKAFFCEEELQQKIIDLHVKSFGDTTHDQGQRQPEGVKKILDNNITVIAYNNANRDLVATSYLEVDPHFEYGNIALIEPTYFTDPDYRNLGLSIHMRLTTTKLVNLSEQIEIYNEKPMLVFNESIRHLSFPIALQIGCELAGNIDSTISGDLGDAYTYLGDANPRTGLMPMGLTYTKDRRLSND